MGLFSNFCACLETKLRIRGHNAAEGALDEVFETNDLFFELRTLELATNFFSELNQLGHGGFGPVYKVCHL
ncbi:RECEPTOR-LIKE SERINE/THREONINE-PROTEIN KINASE SD1-8 [Salix viminalis]|uniref:RECEPTOR-LIKE SERINE/THREONINE-PROTEIN KINASE SD1-8 n=2 Tax=Salix TaxID=40685 RepID=A0A9Q0NMQ9_SALVM|nr:RECEPTOR-LIKE SERINE/THREONINE-PROTEIN KINASE SD1-8 [Salix viminalis]